MGAGERQKVKSQGRILTRRKQDIPAVNAESNDAQRKAKSIFFFVFNVYLFFREREHKQGRGRERGRQRIQSRLCTVSAKPSMGLQPMNHEIMT